jgi:mono/diheme cytochrome c family protein
MVQKLFGLLALVLVLSACQQDAPKIAFSDLPGGSAERGAQIFQQGTNGSVPCSTCHRTDSVTLAGPGLGGIGQRAGTRVEGESAREYLYYSILRPARYLVTGFSNLMPPDFEDKFTAQDVADLIAYLSTL